MSKKRNTLLFFLFISPWIIGFIMFSLGPIIASIYWSFTRYSIVEAPRWVGLDNFYVIFNGFEPNFFNSVRVTVLYSIFAVPGVIIVSLLAAMMLNIPKIKGMSLFRTIYFLPSLLPMVATAIVFAFLLDPKYGLITKFYETLWGAGTSPDWLQQHALGCMVLLAIWGFGNTMMIFLAGLQDVPVSLIEASRIDGANGWQRFCNITVPAISPVIFFNMIMGIIGALQVFTQAYVFARSNDVNRTDTHFYVLNIYEHAFEHGRFGLASSLTWILVIVILIITMIQFHFKKKWVHYND